MRRSASAVFLACVLAAACSRESGPAVEATGEVRTAQVSIVDAAELEAKIAAHRGRGLLVNLWAMW